MSYLSRRLRDEREVPIARQIEERLLVWAELIDIDIIPEGARKLAIDLSKVNNENKGSTES